MKRMGTIILVGSLLILLTPTLIRGDWGLAEPKTYLQITFRSEQGAAMAGVKAILVDADNNEQEGMSNHLGRIMFTLEAKSGFAFVTYWENPDSVYRKVLEYRAGNHYAFDLKLKY